MAQSRNVQPALIHKVQWKVTLPTPFKMRIDHMKFIIMLLSWLPNRPRTPKRTWTKPEIVFAGSHGTHDAPSAQFGEEGRATAE